MNVDLALFATNSLCKYVCVRVRACAFVCVRARVRVCLRVRVRVRVFVCAFAMCVCGFCGLMAVPHLAPHASLPTLSGISPPCCSPTPPSPA